MSEVRAHQLQNIRRIASLVNAGSDVATVFDQVVFAVCHYTNWTRSGVMAVDRNTGFIELVTRHDPDAEDRTDLATRWRLRTSPALRVVETRVPVVIKDAQQCEEFPDYRTDALARGYHTVATLLLGATDLQGREMVLAVQSNQRIDVTENELDFLSAVAQLASIAVDKAKSLHTERLFSSRLQRTLEVNSNLLERVLAGCSTETIIGIVESILPDPLVLLDFTTDTYFAGRSPEPESISDQEWGGVVKGAAGRSLEELIHNGQPTDFLKAYEVDLAGYGIPVARQAYIEPLKVDDETVGGMIIFPRRCELYDLGILIAQEAKFALSVQLMRGHIQFRTEVSDIADLFDRVFEAAWSEPRKIHARAARIGIDLEAPGRLVAIDYGDDIGVANKHYKSRVHRLLDRVIRRNFCNGAVFEHACTFFAHLPGTREITNKLLNILEREIVEAMQWTTAQPPAVASSEVCQSLEDYPAAREECLRVLALARTFGRTGIVKEDDFGPFALLMPALNTRAVQAFIAENLGDIEVYDEQHGSELIETIETFVEQECRYQRTSEVLGIHVSTLRYRLGRIKELFDLDLHNAENRFSVDLALRLRRMLNMVSAIPSG